MCLITFELIYGEDFAGVLALQTMILSSALALEIISCLGLFGRRFVGPWSEELQGVYFENLKK